MLEQAESSLLRARHVTLKDMDASSSLFLSLDRKPRTNSQMLYLRDTRGHTTSDMKDRRNKPTNLYKDLYKAMGCD